MREGGEEKERVENCEADTTLFPKNPSINTCTLSQKHVHTMATQGVILQLFYKQANKDKKPQQHGPKAITRSLGSKPSSLWDTRHGSVAQKYSLPTKGFNIHAGMCGGKKERGCSSNLPSFLHFPLPPLPPKVRTLPLSLLLPSAMQKVSKLTPHPRIRAHTHRKISQ